MEVSIKTIRDKELVKITDVVQAIVRAKLKEDC